MPEIPGAVPVQCGNCSAHFQLDPGGAVAGAACSECGGTRFFRSQPSPTQSDGTLRDMVDSDSQKDEGGNPLGEGTIMGGDGEKPRGFRDNYMHSRVAAPPDMLYEYSDIPEGVSAQDYHNQNHPSLCPICRQPADGTLGFQHHIDTMHPDHVPPNGHYTATKRIEPMRTFNMEPYAPLWDESYIPSKTAGPLMELAAPLVEGGSSLLTRALPTLMRGALGQGAVGLAQGRGEQAGGMAPDPVTPAPGLETLANADIPMLLIARGNCSQCGGKLTSDGDGLFSCSNCGNQVTDEHESVKTADYDTPQSVKSVDEQHDDPEQQDQKEFNDGDKSPKNLQNPNNQDSGTDGEDGVRDATEGYGFGENSPGVERAMMILPLLLHYFESGDSGQSDPLIRGLHDALEKESPGYLEREDPEGQQHVEMIIQQHKSPHHVQAGVNAFTGELPPTPQPGTMQQNPGGGTCPSCGGVLAGDGSCPQCGASAHPQGGMQMPTGMGSAPMGGGGAMGSSGGASYPPTMAPRMGTSGAGPQTPEQKAAVIQLLEHQGRHDEAQLVELEPWRFAHELSQIQGQQNVAPLVDPSQATPPAPMPGMMNPPGAMPMPDPSQPGGGMQQQMQPMAHTADVYGPSTGWPRELPAPRNQEAFHRMEPGESAMGDKLELGQCPNCGGQSLTPFNGVCQNCGFTMPKDSSDVALQQHDPHGAYTGESMNVIPEHLDKMEPHWGKQADANNNVPRCPNCQTATTSVLDGNEGDNQRKYRCHSCQGVFPLNEKDGRVILTDLMNPTLEGAGQEQKPIEGDTSTLVWKDASGRPLEQGQTYELHSPHYPVPDEVQIIAKKPDSLGVKLVGQHANVAHAGDSNTPDFTITADQVASQKFTFVPTGEPSNMDSQPMGGMPGMEQIPQQPQTTDQIANSYPNPGTTASVLSAEPNDIDESYEDVCHKCGCDWVSHTASSETSTMHECARCGTAWETRDNWTGRESHVDLSWLNEDTRDDFFSEMTRAQEMSSYGHQSRSLASAAAKDERLQAVRDVLSHNKSERQQRTAGRHFTPSEQRALVNERGKARNLEDLDLSNTHYTTRYDETGKANGLNAPDEHLILGI